MTYLQRRQEAFDQAWRAWDRLRPLDVGTDAGRHLICDLVGHLREPVERMVEDLGLELDDATFHDVVARAATDLYRHATWSVCGAFGEALGRPPREPFAPPAAGAWLRGRHAARSTTRGSQEPQWATLWHRFSGDWKPGDERFREVRGLTSCGLPIRLRGDDAPISVVAEDMPGVDVCRRCARTVAPPAS